MYKINFIIDKDRNFTTEVLTLDYKKNDDYLEFLDIETDILWVILNNNISKISKVSKEEIK